MHVKRQFDVDRFYRRIKAGEMSRREATASFAAAGLGTLALPMGNGARADDGTGADITYFTWSGYDIPELFQRYVDAHGQPSYSIFASAEEGFQKMRAGFTPDVAHPCIEDMDRWMEAGIMRPIDTSKLTNWNNVFQRMRETRGVSYDGEVFIAPMDWGNSSVIYRTDLVPEGTEESWYMLFDPQYEGRIGASNTSSNAWAAAAVLGFDMFNPTEEQVAGPIADLLRQQRELVRFYWDDQSEVEQAMASGEIITAYAWNAALKNLKDSGTPVAYANPKEGIWTWICGIVRIEGGNDKVDLQHELIDAWLDAETGRWLIENYYYGHSNEKAFELADPTLLSELGWSSPASLFDDGILFEPYDPHVEERYTALFEEIKAGF